LSTIKVVSRLIGIIVERVKAKFHYAILVTDTSKAGRREVQAGRRHAASWNLAYHALSSLLAAS